MEDDLIREFLLKTIYREVIPTLSLPEEELKSFAKEVVNRFNNPYVDHALLSIALNSVSKWRARCMPSLLGYVERFGRLPENLTFSLAALMAFYSTTEMRERALVGYRNGQEYRIQDDLPVLDGATALLPVYAAVAHAVYPADSCPYDENGYLPGSAVQYRNTVGAYQAVVDGTADIVFCAEASAEQKAYAAEQGVELVFQPIGQEAFVFFVNAENPVEALTQEEIRQIYAGQITNWREVGGPDRLIHAIDRKPGSGSQSAMLRFMKGKPIEKKPFAFLGASIGFSFRYYVEGIVADGRIKMLRVDGAEPSAQNIRSGAYPVVSPFYAVYRRDDPNPNVHLLVEWLLSEEGQRIINESGYVGLQ